MGTPIIFFILFIIVSLHSGLSNNQRTIYSHSEYYKVNQGSPIEFQCAVSHPDQVTGYFWSLRNIISHNNLCYLNHTCEAGMKDGNIVFFVIHKVELSDQGDYTCQVFWNNTTIVTLNHTLVVLVPPRITQLENTFFELKEGDQMEVSCEATGFPEPSISWSRHSIYDYDYGSLNDGDAVFSIDSASRADEGRYECRAENEAGSDKQAISVNILFKPEASVGHGRVYCGVSYKCIVECSFEGYPEVSVVWSHPVTSELYPPARWMEDVKTEAPNSVSAVLSIQDSKPADVGMYTCFGSNYIGTATENVELTFKPTTPNITSLLRINFFPDRYLLEWNLNSFAKLKNFEAVFHWIVNDTTAVYLANMTIQAREIKLPIKYQTIRMPIMSPNYIQSEMLSSLRRGSKYSVQMRARNEFGFSEWSPVGYFKTAGRLRSSSPNLHPTLLSTLSCLILLLLILLLSHH